MKSYHDNGCRTHVQKGVNGMIKVFLLISAMALNICAMEANVDNDNSIDASQLTNLSIQDESNEAKVSGSDVNLADESRTLQDMYRSLSAVVNRVGQSERNQKLVELFNVLISMYDALKANIYYADDLVRFLLNKETLEGEIWDMFCPEWKILVQTQKTYFESELALLESIMSEEKAKTFDYQKEVNDIMDKYITEDAKKCELVTNKSNALLAKLEAKSFNGTLKEKVISLVNYNFCMQYLFILNLNIAKVKWTVASIDKHAAEVETNINQIKEYNKMLETIALKEAEKETREKDAAITKEKV